MSSRICVHYGGFIYTISGRRPDDVRQELDDALRRGKPHWLEANFGEGRLTPVRLLVTTGVTIALVPEPDGDAEEQSWGFEQQ
ncbi:hypothetical protein [Naasia sp. SYSU D00057]|uniref:hypothetical protein n=1 Tax=Naasia sp. SYSU D00057 TaxID=2817380 RepID=UPI001B30CA63|nr:hypothetical protein [Naasia sp. SYSU D00057]